MPAVKAAATPRPIRARPRSSIEKFSDAANSAEPSAATTINALWTRRGPYRSRRMPIGIWAAAKVRK